MVQLKVYDGSDQYFLDLLSTDPIKLTLSIEDITNADARSTFSRTFRVPSTKNNNQFFKNAFLVDGIDFDVTVKKQAEILYNGAEYKVGHIRLQKIYHNKMERNTEYEIVFLGETRDFASALGEKTLADLDLSMYDHDQTYANISQSWEAWPSDKKADGTPITPSVTNGLLSGVQYTNPFGEIIDLGGDILYPLINFGEDETTDVRIAIGGSSGYFDHDGSNGSINVNRFKPMIRAKALWDRIFEQAGFTYESQIADSTDFRQLYVSAFGNEGTIVLESGSANELDVSIIDEFYWSGPGFEIIEFDDVVKDPSNNFSTSTYKYTVPVDGEYLVQANLTGGISVLCSNIGATSATASTRLVHYDASTGTTNQYAPINDVVTGDECDPNEPGEQCGRPLTWNVQHSYLISSLGAGDELWFEVTFFGDLCSDYPNSVDSNSSFTIPDAQGGIGISTLLDQDYKQIDFIRDMLTKFRLVMAPDKIDPKKFIVEPWVDYIASGDLHDWSDNLDESKDLQLEPLFFTQSARLEFTDKPDQDWLNDLNEKKFKETFGTLKIDSGNELLKGTREIKTNFAPTPITQIEGGELTNFVIPRIYARDTQDGATQVEIERTPIKAITRLLFYNGLFTVGPASELPNANWRWYVNEETTPGNFVYYDHTDFPMISYWQNFNATTGPNASSVNLNWQIERGYANDVPGYNFNWTNGVSMYQRFWRSYINSLYNKFARRLTAYFTLSVEDLFNFSFDDIIFVNGSYYRPEKLTDVIVGQKSLVKVDLIKLLDYGVDIAQGGGIGGDEPVDPVTYTDSNGHVYTTESTVWEMTPCDDPNATPIIVGPANMVVQAGQSAVVNNECYTFDQPVFWQESYQTPIEVSGTTTYADCATCECATASTLTVTVTNTTDATCNQNNGSLTFISSGGVAPFTYVITDSANNTVITVTRSSHITNTLTSIGSDDYTVTVTDACGATANDTARVFDDCGPNGPSD